MNRSSGRFGFTRLIFASALVLAIHPSATPSGAQDPPAEDDASASLAGVDRSRWFADQQALQLRITGLRLEGKLKEAVALGNKAVTRSREFLGELDERTITALRNLAALYEEQENWPAARRSWRRCAAFASANRTERTGRSTTPAALWPTWTAAPR